MSDNKTMKVVKVSFTVIFLFFIIIRIWFDLSEFGRLRPFTLLLPLTFIFITYYQKKISWLLAMILFVYGLYYYFFKRIWVAYPGAFEFTQPLNELMYGDKHGYTTGHLFQRYLTLFPLLFYVVTIITFLTTPIRKLYWTKPPL
jgi:hypothetical protein